MTVNAAHLVDEIFSGLEQIEAEERVKQQFRHLVESISMVYGIRGIEQTERINFARRLHAAKTSRATIRDRLIARYGISRRQAYRIISDSLQLCQKRP